MTTLTNENKQILTDSGETGQKRDKKWAKKGGKKWQKQAKTSKDGQKDAQRQTKKGEKTETWQNIANQKFCQILVWDRPTLVTI